MTLTGGRPQTRIGARTRTGIGGSAGYNGGVNRPSTRVQPPSTASWLAVT